MTQTALDILAELGAGTTHALWLPVLVWTGLALPLWALLHGSNRLHPNAEYRLSQVLLAALPASIVVVSVVGKLPDVAHTAPFLAQSVVVLPVIEPPPRPTPVASWSWIHAVGLLTSGALGLGLFHLGRLALEIIAVSRIRRRLVTARSRSLQVEVNRLRKRLHVHRPLRICTSPDVTVPMTLGGLQPTVLIPRRLTEATGELRMTLRHELIHIRRWDDFAQLAERLVDALFAIHPLVGHLRRQIAEARERACDAAVLDDGETPPGDYARLLATFADEASPSPIGALSFSESPSSLIDRLSAMRSSMPSLLSSRLALGTALVATGLTLTLGVVACSETTGPPLSDGAEKPDRSSQTALQGDHVDTPPKPVGGLPAVQESIAYPKMAKEAGIEGRVVVQFVVDKEGNVTHPTVVRGNHKLLNKAALETLKSQTFKPGRKEGEPVPVQMSFPITFRLPDEPSHAPNTTNEGAVSSGFPPNTESGGRLFEKAGIQLVRVLMNVDGNLLLDGERVTVAGLTDAVRRRITKDAARAALLYADGAPADRVAAAKARLNALALQNVYVKKVE